MRFAVRADLFRKWNPWGGACCDCGTRVGKWGTRLNCDENLWCLRLRGARVGRPLWNLLGFSRDTADSCQGFPSGWMSSGAALPRVSCELAPPLLEGGDGSS